MKNKQRWNTLKIIAINWTFFVLIAASVALWMLLSERKELFKENAEIQMKLENCQSNWEEVEKQISSGRIVLELQK